jgi:hypothetical protein
VDDAPLPSQPSPPPTSSVEPRTSGTSPPKALPPTRFEAITERVHKSYGAFGVRVRRNDAEERRVLADSGSKTTLLTIAVVLAASTFLAFASHPAWSPHGEWMTAFRLDAAFVVIWGPLLYWVMARHKLSQSMRVYLTLALFIEAFSEVMFVEKGEGGYWNSILWPAAVGWFGTIKELTGLPGASLSVFFLATVGLLARAVWGSPRSMGEGGAERVRPPKLARNLLLVFLGVVLMLATIGVARGGQVDWTFRQVISLVQLPIVALLFLYAVRVPEDLPAIGTAYVLIALVRSLLVMFVYVGVCMPQGIHLLPGKPEWCTNHSDTVLFVTALVVLFAHALEQRKSKVSLRNAAVGLVILLGIVLNNRRVAFISLGIAPLVIYFVLDPSRRKRRVTLVLGLLVPLVAAYVLVGSEIASASPLLKPAKAIVSILEQSDNSALSRDIENDNLVYTLHGSPLFGNGFGHEYNFAPEHPPVDLSETFQNYRLIAHNGVLWAWALGGFVGFTALWLIYPITGTLAIRGYRTATTALERTASLVALGAVAICVIQIWGDQGFSSYLTIVTFGVAFAVAARLALRARTRGDDGTESVWP